MINSYQFKKEISSIAKDALIDYFQPITYAFKALNKTLRFEDEKRALINENSSSRNVIHVMQKAVCFNQGRYLEYTFITAEKHRNLKDAFRKNKNDIDHLAILTKELTDYINTTFYENTHENFKILHAYFKSRKGSAPRICIKGSFRMNDKSTVVSVFRDSLVNYDSNSEVEDNFGFKSIYSNGTYFLENNIPKATAEGRYFNPRLKQDCVKSYLGYKKGKKIKWDDCWAGDKKDKSSFYKSTMIVPMTLWNNKVSDEFKKLINMSNVDRTIFGFLCFDHEEADYFHEEDDVAVGYIFADILSMYVFTRLIYMEISKTFSKAEKWLVEKEHFPQPEMLSNIWKSIPVGLDPEELLSFKVKKTKENDLFPIDADLLKFVKSLKENANK